MGQIILLSCKKCGFQKELSTGAGLMGNDPEAVASELDIGEAKEWRKLHRDNKISFFDARKKVFYCENCNDIVSRLAVTAVLTDGNEINFGGKCQICGHKLAEMDMEAHHIFCPVCKGGGMCAEEIGLWD